MTTRTTCDHRLAAPKPGEVTYCWTSGSTEVMAFRHGGKLLTCNAICPHMGARLDVDFRHGKVACPWHGLSFNIPGFQSDHPRYRRLHANEAAEKDGYVQLAPEGVHVPADPA